MFEVFDPRTPEVNVTTTRTRLGARLTVAARTRLHVLRNGVGTSFWLDYAREGERW